MITTAITELLGGRSQKLIADCSEKLLYSHIFIDIGEIFYRRLDRCGCFADDFGLQMELKYGRKFTICKIHRKVYCERIVGGNTLSNVNKSFNEN